MPKKVAIGVVTGGKAKKTRRVEVARLVRHPRYGKTLRTRTVCIVHDENEASQAGDTVEIRECRPMSRRKRWELLRVVERSREAGAPELPAENIPGQDAPAQELPKV
ncbi:MAG: 30S ribosomal protein S17 [Planctomycetia bacterium]|nr:30S ribosomal protein S17 [Planctomycetia bacterium]